MPKALPLWRPMRAADVAPALALAARAHPSLPEDEAVFAERLALFAPGCMVLEAGRPGEEAHEGGGEGATLCGYALSHPIKRFEPPPLNARLGGLAPDANDYYIHDFVVAREQRGAGQARRGVEQLLRLAAVYASASLISVYGTAPFWRRFGFEPVREASMDAKLSAYGEDAVYMVRPGPSEAG